MIPHIHCMIQLCVRDFAHPEYLHLLVYFIDWSSVLKVIMYRIFCIIDKVVVDVSIP